MRLVVAITGASGAPYSLKLLETCKKLGIETELIMSKNADNLLKLELGKNPKDLQKLATRSYLPDDLEAPPSSGSHPTDGMVIVPCSMKTLGEVANGISHDLITRAADVTLKQNRTLVLVPRDSVEPDSFGKHDKAQACRGHHTSSRARVLHQAREDIGHGRFHRWSGSRNVRRGPQTLSPLGWLR